MGRARASRSRAPAIDLDKLRGWKDGVVKRLTGGLAGLAKQRKVTTVVGHRQVRLAEPARGRAADGGAKTVSVRAGDHRRRLGAGHPALHPARRPAGDRLHRRARTRRHPEAPARHRRRDHRARDGDRLPRARREGDDRRADGPDHPGRRQGHRHAAAEADREALRDDPPQDQGDEGRGRPGRAHRAPSRAAKAPATDIFDQHPGRGRPPAERQADRGRERGRARSTSGASSRSTGRCAPTSCTSSPSATSSASRCWPTRRCTRARSRPRRRPATTASSTPR